MNLFSTILILTSLFIFYQTHFVGTETEKLMQLKSSVQKTSFNIEKLEDENQRLKLKIGDLRNDYEIIEGLARLKLGMKKNDEIFIRIPTVEQVFREE